MRVRIAGCLSLALVVAMIGVPAWSTVICRVEGERLAIEVESRTGGLEIVRDGSEILVLTQDGAVPCDAGPPTIETVDEVVVRDLTDRSVELTLDLGGGAFVDDRAEIGFNVDLDPDGRSENDRLMIVGTAGPDHVALGVEGINLNAGEPGDTGVDLVSVNIDRHVLIMGDGADVVDGGGMQSGPFPMRIVVLGGAGGDELIGGDAGDVLRGESDADELLGGPGRDELIGGSGGDELEGGPGDDLLVGGTGRDVEEGGNGDDLFDQGTVADSDDLHGGPGEDVVAYDRRSADIVVSLDGLPGDGQEGEQDNVWTDVESVLGGAGHDEIRGNDADNTLSGGPGKDVLEGAGGADVLGGGPGEDTLRGGDGVDTATFFSSLRAVKVDLTAGTATGHGDDLLQGIEDVRGGRGDDVLIGNEGPNRLFGDRGHDLLMGGEGDDVLQGGAGRDRVSFLSAAGPIRVSLGAGTAKGQGSDSLRGVVAITGSGHDDRLQGDGRANWLLGRGGDDVLLGKGGPDLLVGGPGSDLLDGGRGCDRCRPGPGGDTVRRCP